MSSESFGSKPSKHQKTSRRLPNLHTMPVYFDEDLVVLGCDEAGDVPIHRDIADFFYISIASFHPIRPQVIQFMELSSYW